MGFAGFALRKHTAFLALLTARWRAQFAAPTAMPLTRRAPRKASSKASSSEEDSDTGTDTELNAAAPAPAAKHSKGENKLKKLLKRLIFGTMLLWTQIGIIAAGHLPVLVEVQLIQIAMFRELVNVRYSKRIHKDVPLFRTTQWGWFYACMLYSYGKSFSTDQRLYSLVKSPTAQALLPYAEAVSMLAYSLLLVTSVLALRAGHYRYQVGQLAWTIAIIVITVAQVNSFIDNIFNGLFWYMFPVSLVICNDSMAYFCGMAFGKKFIKARFLGALSPNKTWEGFIGGGFFTLIWAFTFPLLLSCFDPLICPADDLALGKSFSLRCDTPAVFQWRTFDAPALGWAGISQITLLPIQLHALVLGLFASVVAPFGGFFASGIKRAYKMDDFASLIPGHGGVFDRVDCQLIMGLATQIYFTTFIGRYPLSLARVQSLVAALSVADQRELHAALGKALKAMPRS